MSLEGASLHSVHSAQLVDETNLFVPMWLQENGVGVLFSSFFFFHALYWCSRFFFPAISPTYNNLEEHQKGYWCSSAVSSLHAVILSSVAAYVLYSDPGILNSNNVFYPSEKSKFGIGIFLGYLMHDLSVALYYGSRWSGWVANLMHHISVITVWSMFYYYDFGHFFASVGHFCEITTPFVNQRWFFYECNMKFSKAYHYNGIIMTVLWFFTRIILYSYTGVELILKINQWVQVGYFKMTLIYMCYFLGAFLQYFWFYKIVKGALKSISTASRRKSI